MLAEPLEGKVDERDGRYSEAFVRCLRLPNTEDMMVEEDRADIDLGCRLIDATKCSHGDNALTDKVGLVQIGERSGSKWG